MIGNQSFDGGNAGEPRAREAPGRLRVHAAERVDRKDRALRHQPKALGAERRTAPMAERRKRRREQCRIRARTGGKKQRALRMGSHRNQPRWAQSLPVLGFACPRLGQMQPLGPDAGGKRRIARNEKIEVAFASDRFQRGRKRHPRCFIGVTQNDRRACRKRARGRDRIAKPRFVGHQDQRR